MIKYFVNKTYKFNFIFHFNVNFKLKSGEDSFEIILK